MWLEKRGGKPGKDGKKGKITYYACWREESGQVLNPAGPLKLRPTWRKRKIKLGRDYSAARAKLGALLKQRLRGEEFQNHYAEHRNKTISSHVEDWIAELEADGCRASYYEQCRSRLNRLVKECSWLTLRDMTGNSFLNWRKTATSDVAHNRKDKAALERERMAARTQNHYLVTLRTFTKWCVRRKRLPTDPVADVGKVNEVGDVRRARRSLTVDEIVRLMDAVPEKYRLAYRLLLTTGLRVSEAAQLVWGDLRLDVVQPHIQLRADTTKAGRGDLLPLRADMAEDLRLARGDAADGDRVFRRIPRNHQHMRWLAAAGIPYTDSAGRRADMHALRHTFGSLLSVSGVLPREAMSLMRHTDMKLTMRTYTDSSMLKLDQAVAKLPIPALPRSTRRPIQGRAWGTRGAKRGALEVIRKHRYALAITRKQEGETPESSGKSGVLREITDLIKDVMKKRAKGVEPSTFTLAT